jgi:hypothetical protein
VLKKLKRKTSLPDLGMDEKIVVKLCEISSSHGGEYDVQTHP